MALYDRLLEDLRAEVGPIATRPDRDRVRAGYDVSRVDLLRALLSVADGDASLRTAVADRVRARYGVMTP
ncbi:hypothetical protein [Actinomycetospora flava]|uniref:Uncharacterized protein n=1 Tax=Actinomycetospora flava TaxID=3129232 RepID=A0ABU8MFN9_9PSEU